VLSLLRFLILLVVLVGLLVFVVVPAVASPLLTQAVRDAGLQADDLEVRLEAFDASLLAGRLARLRVQATNAAIPPASVGGLDLAFDGVGFFTRDFEAVRGELSDVAVGAGGLDLAVASVTIDGPANAARATGQLDRAQTRGLIRAAAQRAGIRVSDVELGDGGLTVTVAGISVPAAITVRGGALVLEPQVGPPVLLLQPAPSDAWRLSEAYVTRDGLRISGVIDAARLAEGLTGAP
jgi:hypothetical protein